MSRGHLYPSELNHAVLLTEVATSHGDRDLHLGRVHNLEGHCISVSPLHHISVHLSPKGKIERCTLK